MWQVVVDFNGAEGKGEDIKSVTESASLKVLPPWMIKQGMSLTKEQRGEVKQDMKMDEALTSNTAQYSDDKKSTVEQDDKKSLQASTDKLMLFLLMLKLFVTWCLPLIPKLAKNDYSYCDISFLSSYRMNTSRLIMQHSSRNNKNWKRLRKHKSNHQIHLHLRILLVVLRNVRLAWNQNVKKTMILNGRRLQFQVTISLPDSIRTKIWIPTWNLLHSLLTPLLIFFPKKNKMLPLPRKNLKIY